MPTPEPGSFILNVFFTNIWKNGIFFCKFKLLIMQVKDVDKKSVFSYNILMVNKDGLSDGKFTKTRLIHFLRLNWKKPEDPPFLNSFLNSLFDDSVVLTTYPSPPPLLTTYPPPPGI